MKKNAIQVGTKVAVKVPEKGTANQLSGTIAAIDDSNITVAIADEEGRESRNITIPRNSAEILAFIENPNKPDAVVKDGTLMVNGEVVRTGSGFKVKSILAVGADTVYISVAADDSGKDNVYKYTVCSDIFELVAFSLPLDTKASIEVNGTIVIPYLNTREGDRVIDKEDGTKETVKCEYLTSAGYLIISTKLNTVVVTKSDMFSNPFADVIPVGDSAFYIVSTSDKREEDFGLITSLEDKGLIINIYIYRIQEASFAPVASAMGKGDYVSTTVAGRTCVFKTTECIKVIANRQIYVITDKDAIKELDGFNYVVKGEQCGGVLTLYFADESYGIKVYSVTHSRDARGPIIEVK